MSLKHTRTFDGEPSEEDGDFAAPATNSTGSDAFSATAVAEPHGSDGEETAVAEPVDGRSATADDNDGTALPGLVPKPAQGLSAMMPGTVIKHYEIIRQLGAGGMGVVFLARDTRLGRLVAIKFLLTYSGSAVHRFLIEARTTAQCRHDNIVVIYDVDEFQGYPYIVLEYVEGRMLRNVIAERQNEMAALALNIMLPVARAVAFAHDMGIVHRDLKPENILLSNAGQVKVLDFGIAKQIAPPSPTTSSEAPMPQLDLSAHTQDGAIVGSLYYMSPEQLKGQPIDGRTDVWAIGIIFFELLVGVHPMSTVPPPRFVGMMSTSAPLPRVHDMCPEAGALGDIVDRCLAKNKDQRWGSAKELVLALEPLTAAKTRPVLAEGASPFAGLTAFQEVDASRFFGRDADVAAVVARLRNQQLVAIAGPSGAGKSSFVRAGVIPALKQAGSNVEAFVIRPGRRPLGALADVLAFFTDSSGETEDESNAEAITERLRIQPGYLGARLRARCRKRGAAQRIVLFVDQLEELYTLGTDPAERAAFAACIEGVADDASSPLRVIVTIRADFLDRLSEDRRLLAEVTRGLLYLLPMGRKGLRDALTKPLDATPYRFEDDDLVEEMLHGLEGTRSPLPILQFTATKLWDTRDIERRLLTREAYRAFGGVAGALSTHADAVLSSLSVPDQRLARAIFLRLVTVDRTRAIVEWDELSALSEDAAAVDPVLAHLADARLIAIETGGPREGKVVELAHESLIERWGKLRQWLDENEQDAQFLVELRSASAQWENNAGAEGFLWRDRAAIEAGQWLQKRKINGTLDLAKREQRYLEAVVALTERTRRWRQRIVAGVVAMAIVVTVVVSTLALRAREQARRADEQAKRADEQAQDAQQQARRARNATRLAVASKRLSDPTVTLALLREMEPSSLPRGWSELTTWAQSTPVASIVLHAGAPTLRGMFSPDGTRIVAGLSDKTVRIWNANGTENPIVLRGHEGPVIFAAFSPDGKRVVSGAADYTGRIWNADGTEQPIVLKGHTDTVHCIAFSPDGQHIVSASDDGTVRVWNANGSGQPLVLKWHTGPVSWAAFSPDSQRIVSASYDHTVRMGDADGTGKPHVFEGHTERVRSAAFSLDGKRIVSASIDQTVRVWNANGAGDPVILRGHSDVVTSAAFSPDGEYVVSSATDKTMRVWHADGSGQPVIFQGHEGAVQVAAFSPDGKSIMTTSRDGTVRVWNTNSAGRRLILRGHEGSVETIAFSPDGQKIASGATDRTVRIWNANGTGLPLVLRGHESLVSSVAWSPDGRRVASASDDRTVRIWMADGSGQPLILSGPDGFNHVSFSSDGQRVLAPSERKLWIWNADGSGNTRQLSGHEQFVRVANFSPDGKHIASGSDDRTVRVWNADGSGQPIVLRGHENNILDVAFSPDGKRIVSGCVDQTLRLWNADGSGQPLVFRGHTGLVNGAKFSPDGERLVSASSDGTVRVWRADGTGEPLVLRVSTEEVSMALFSPDGQRIATAMSDGTIVVWTNVEPIAGLDDPGLWTATRYCMPLDVRRRLLDFPDEQSLADLQRCEQNVARFGQRLSP